MREIKFRAWEHIEKRFLTWDEVQENTIQDVFRLFDCQQFTGLHDENGKEIHEGDIVTLPGHYSGDYWNADTNGNIIFDEGSWMICGGNGWYDLYEHVLNNCVTIIGNIHENPELLEATK